MKLYIIRHGETFGNLNGDGFSETNLTPKGERQIELLGERFKEESIDKFYVSPLVRAVKTANAVRKYHKNTPIIIDSLLLEKGTEPHYIGLADEEIKKLCPDAQINRRTPLGEENDEKAYNRAKEIIEKIKAENDFESTIVIIAHGTFNSYLVLAALDFPFKENFNFSHVNTGVSLVQTIKENDVIKTKLKFLNDYSHLDELPQT
ncbi:MAG: histidine phosphatase family protein [Clostridia bacterium]|nr:histidine phosphatase family protein [Clostridia bacterium]